MPTTQQIVQSLDVRLRELNDEIKALAAARSALDDGDTGRPPRSFADLTNRRGSPRRSRFGASGPSSREAPADASQARPVRSRTTKRKVSPPGASPTVEVVSTETIESLLSHNGGLSTSAVAEQTGGNRVQVLRKLRELEAAGRIRRVGQRRGTRWRAITDEDRISARAAELEARRRRAR
jgi:hypothetical protein